MLDTTDSTTKVVLLNFRSEEYEPMILGTRCPVSPDVLRQWYWEEGLSCTEISIRLTGTGFKCTEGAIRRYMKIAGIERRANFEGFKLHISKFGFSTAMRENFKNLCLASAKIRREKRTANKTCLNCGTSFYISLSHINRGEGKYCSRKCRCIARSTGKYKARRTGEFKIKRPRKYKTKNVEILNNLSCPSCGNAELRKRGLREKSQLFCCRECMHRTVRPIIKPGLLQDLEAAGALDDGRILVSAFK